jgi:hypothetical protein
MTVMTADIYGIRNQVHAPLDPGDVGLALRRLAGLLGGGLEQTPDRLHGHGRPHQP